jgi:hypothetical protein
MKSDDSTDSAPLTPQLLYALRYYVGNRKVLIGLAVVALAGGMALNWSWLVAAGLAPIILALAPCAAMCALGLCMNKMGQKSCDSQTNNADDAVSKVSAAPETHETHALPSTTLEASSSETGSKITVVPSAAAERKFSADPTTKAKEKYDAYDA